MKPILVVCGHTTSASKTLMLAAAIETLRQQGLTVVVVAPEQLPTGHTATAYFEDEIIPAPKPPRILPLSEEPNWKRKRYFGGRKKRQER